MEAWLTQVPLFREATPETVRQVLAAEGVIRQRWSAGEHMHMQGKALGLLKSGKVRVVKPVGAHHEVLISILHPGDLFGAAALFGGADVGNEMVCLTACEAILIPEAVLRRLMTEHTALAFNYMAYLTGRILFLNQRLEGVTGGSTHRRLAHHLARQAVVCSEALVVETELSMTALAQLLNMSRASLYRALDELEQQRFIRREGKRVWIDDIDALLAI